jgi:phage shock protein PspC (stress-responsive transcriptional regulator)
MILELIHRMGSPEDFDLYEQPPQRASGQSSTTPPHSVHRKLYRDPDNRYLAGVSSGLAHYFGIAPLYVRIIFVVLQFFLGFGMVAYLLLWFIMPEAETNTQKLEMMGEPVNLSNLEKLVRSEVEHLSANLKLVPFLSMAKSAGRVFVELLKGFGLFFQGVFQVLSIGLGAGLALGGTLALSLLSALFFFRHISILPGIAEHESLFQLLGLVVPVWQINFTLAALFVFAALPLLMLAYGGVKMMFHIKARDKWVFVAATVVWIISMSALSLVAIQSAKNFSRQADVFTSVPLPTTVADTLYVDAQVLAQSPNIFDHELPKFDHTYFIRNSNHKPEAYLVPHFDIRPSNDTLSHLEIEVHGFGPTDEKARLAARSVKYSYQLSGSNTLLLSHYTHLSDSLGWHGQSVKLVLRIPVGQVVYLLENTRHIIDNIDNIQNTWDGDMPNLQWIMTPEGLSQYPIPPDAPPAPDSVPAPPHDEGEFEQLQSESAKN